MDKNALWKWLILIGLVAFSLWVATPPKEKVRLGLDLKGGTSFVVKIDEEQVESEIRSRGGTLGDADVAKEVAAVLEGAQARALEVIRNRIDTLGISEPIIYPGADNRIVIQLPGVDESKRKEAEDSVQSLAFLEFRMVHEKNDELVGALFEKKRAPEGFRIAQATGGDRVFKRDKTFPDERMDRAYHATLGRFEAPGSDYELLMEKEDKQGEIVYKPVFVKRRPELTGEFLKDASVDYRSLGQPVVKIQFDSKGSKRFSIVTSDYAPGGARNPNPNTFRQLAIVLDGTLYSAPVIREAIYGGKAEISGSFTLQEANFLANILRAGSLPAPVKIVEKRFVAPSLGSDSIRSGVRAAVYGAVGVVVFMLVYYRVSGVIANLALTLNLVLLPLGMIIAAGFLGIFARDAAGGGPIRLPVLTMPGIAGIVLTIGMAVDANVLIFERIREEMTAGKRLWTAVQAGYDRAFLAIFDSNLTTLLSGIIMFIFGSGPIRGFAVTLCAGILVSMFTALVVTKLLFGLIASKNISVLKMLSLIRGSSFDFLARRKMAALASVALIAATWGWMAAKGIQNPTRVFGVDFTGGSAVTMTFTKRESMEDLRSTLTKAGLIGASVQYQHEMEAGGTEYLVVNTTAGSGMEEKISKVIADALRTAFPSSGFKVAQEDVVGAQIGAELKGRALWSIALSLVGIILYLAWRFEMGFAVGAIVALLHDVLVTVGVYCLFDRQLSLPIVAALLTIIGYSVNDTIVIFDRIREDVKLVRNKTFAEICNLSINQTLSRTVLTSLTTLITVVSLLIFGGGAINDFALALFIGMIAGVYSTVFIATPVVIWWHRGKTPDLRGKASVK